MQGEDPPGGKKAKTGPKGKNQMGNKRRKLEKYQMEPDDDSHAGRSAMYRTISTACGIARERRPLTRAILGLAWEATLLHLLTLFDLIWFGLISFLFWG